MKGGLARLFNRVRLNLSGSTLIITLITLAVAAFLAAAVTTAVLTANAVSAQNANAQQAYFTARSAVNIIKQCIIDNQNSNQNIADDMVNCTKSGYEVPGIDKNKMGKGTVRVEYWNRAGDTESITPTNTLRIVGTGSYRGTVRSVSAFMQNISTFKYTVYAAQNFSTSYVSVNTDSDIFSVNTVSILQEVHAKSVTSLQNISITPSGGTSTIGEVHARNGVQIGSGVTVTGDVTSGQTNGINNSGTILGKQLCQNTEYIDSLVASNETLSSFTIDNTDSTYGDKNYVKSTTTQIKTKNISESGTITANSFQSGDKITVDTTQGDIWLYFGNINNSGSNINLSNVTITKKGGNKVYFYLMNNMQVTFDNCSIISNNSVNADIFIFSQSNSAHLYIGSSNIIDACIFVDLQSEVKLTGTGSVINGSITAQQITANSGCLLKINNVPPNIAGTPLEKVVDMNRHYYTSWAFTGWAGR